MFSNEFCGKFHQDFLITTKFLNFELIKYFEGIRNYILCYKEKNYLMETDQFEFRKDRDLSFDITDCEEENNCDNFCNRYSLAQLPEEFIGKYESLNEMYNFLNENKADNRGFFVDEQNEEEKGGPEVSRMEFIEEKKP